MVVHCTGAGDRRREQHGAPATDQRGQARIKKGDAKGGSVIDIGAVEK